MTVEMKKNNESYSVIDISKMDLSTLVGREVLLLTDQLDGKPLKSRVVLVNDRILSLDRSGSDGLIDKLDNDQKLIIQFEYKGQRISVNAIFNRSEGKRCNITIGKEVVPLSRRRFVRIKNEKTVKCAVVPIKSFDPAKLTKLRWVETHSVNFSSGGILLSLPTNLTRETYLLLNIDGGEYTLPTLIIGQVRYCYPVDSYNYFVGVEFIVDELKEKHFNRATIKKMPAPVFEYNSRKRSELEKIINGRYERNYG